MESGLVLRGWCVALIYGFRGDTIAHPYYIANTYHIAHSLHPNMIISMELLIHASYNA